MDSFVSIVTRLWSGQSVARFLAGARVFSSPKHPPILLLSGSRAVFLGVKCPGHEVNLSLPSRATVKNEWTYVQVSFLYMLPWHGQAQLYLPLCSKQKILCNIITHSCNDSFFPLVWKGTQQNSFSCMILLYKFLQTVSKLPDHVTCGNIDLIHANYSPPPWYRLFHVHFFKKGISISFFPVQTF
jgi:hypothetical protein